MIREISKTDMRNVIFDLELFSDMAENIFKKNVTKTL